MRKLFAFLLCCVTFAVSAQAQSVRGTVTSDADGAPVAGVIVLIEGTGSYATTNAAGVYTIAASRGDVLSFQLIGFETQNVTVGAGSVIDVVMVQDAELIDDVVVTALGIRREAKALGYAVSEVGADEITAGREQNAILSLSGKVAGVDISTGAGGPSGSTRVVIRGNSQLTGSNLPLYVVDGIPMDNTNLGSAGQWGGYDLGDGLSSVNPDDIESISVLKGASASALYGSRAANGVVFITTKSAGKDQGLGVEFSTNLNAVAIGRSFDDYQRVYGQGRNGRLTVQADDAATSTQSAWGAKMDPNLTVPIYNGEMKPYGNVNNNILSFFRTGYTVTNSIAVAKATDKADFRVSISDMRNADIVPKSDMSRTTFMLKGGMKLSDKVSVEARANYTREDVNNRPALSDSPNNIGNSIIGIAPNFDQKWLSEGYRDEFGRYQSWNGNPFRINPYWVLNEMTNESIKDRIMGHIQLNYQILPYLSFRATAGTDFYNFKMSEYAPMTTPGAETGSMQETLINTMESNMEAVLFFNKTFDERFNLGAFVGANMMKFEMQRRTIFGKNEVIPGMTSINNYTEYNTPEIFNPRKAENSVFGSVNLGYEDWLFVDGTLRMDSNSTLSRDNRNYFYYSLSGSWVFSSMFDIEHGPISFGKLRASYADVGGGTDPYALNLEYGLREFSLNGMPLGEISSSTIPFRGLKPTSTRSWEVGLDLRFFLDRLKLDIGYYHTSTIDQILNLPTSQASGYNAKTINSGKITNQGIELSLSGIPVRTGNFEWTSTLNLSRNVNKVVALHPDVKNYELGAARWANAYIYAMEGQAYGVIMGRKFARDEAGNQILQNGMPVYGTEMEVLGNGNYDFMMGWGNTFRWKGISLNVLMDMKWGADLFSMTDMQSHSNGTSKETLVGRQEWYDSEQARIAANQSTANWTPTGGYVAEGVMLDGDGNYVPNTVAVDPQLFWANINENTAEPYIHDASYIKLRELAVSWDVPIKSGKFVKGLTVTAYGRNLWLIYSKIPNIDPESNYNNGNGQGFEYGSLPSRRTFGGGVSLKF